MQAAELLLRADELSRRRDNALHGNLDDAKAVGEHWSIFMNNREMSLFWRSFLAESGECASIEFILDDLSAHHVKDFVAIGYWLHRYILPVFWKNTCAIRLRVPNKTPRSLQCVSHKELSADG
ncbi:hypothetical protein [Tahibacter amnicola]|uniref:Uncharacterized protein n=1 Tax=Tahibacter amnicola TaxID=2976241 RepID=A0ABY6BDZ2_9GAMM|nr:hypothetical protein [Tahibacter amnicola]UXI68012.1 hypothetical protein N4264_25345 [Tahibacter amnicola]